MQNPDIHIERVRRLLTRSPLIDCHNDAPWRFRKEHEGNLDSLDFSKDTSRANPIMKTDLPRLRQGCVGAQFWSAFIPDSWAGPGAAEALKKQMQLIKRLISRYPDDLETARTSGEILTIFQNGRIASLIGIEGGHSIENSIEVLRDAFSKGARYMTLTCSKSNELADSATGERLHGGLSPFGEKIVREMNRIGMMVDLSHTSDDVMRDALELSDSPVIFSHSCARALCDSKRNVPDDVLRRVAQKEGVVCVTFVPMFLTDPSRLYYDKKILEWKKLEKQFPDRPKQVEEEIKKWEKENPSPPVKISNVADHIDHIRQVAGIDHLGIGSDFGGIRTSPDDLEDVSKYPDLFAELLSRGYSPEDIQKIAGGNVLRVMREVEKSAE